LAETPVILMFHVVEGPVSVGVNTTVQSCSVVISAAQCTHRVLCVLKSFVRSCHTTTKVLICPALVPAYV